MDIALLELQTRDTSIKAKDYLKQGMIPVEFYGRGVENKSLKVDYQTFRRMYNKAGSNTVVELDVDGKEKIKALVHEVEYHPVNDSIMHVDFINVRMDEELHTSIPLKGHGIAPAVKELAGILVTNLNAVEVKCLPGDLIHSIEYSIESLVDFHTYVRVKDLQVPSTIVILNDPESIVATVVAPKVEEEHTVSVAAEGAETAAAAEGATDDKAEGKKDESK